MGSFAPVVGANPRVLILGSMPGLTSLNEQQYYAHPRNAFWWLMSELLGVPVELDYLARVEQLKLAGIAVWDVLYDCDRPGSLDSNIVRASEKPNDILGLLAKHSSIQMLAFNGAAAKSIFKRHCQSDLAGIKCVQLPSTSPAHAALSKADKLIVWRQALSYGLQSKLGAP